MATPALNTSLRSGSIQNGPSSVPTLGVPPSDKLAAARDRLALRSSSRFSSNNAQPLPGASLVKPSLRIGSMMSGNSSGSTPNADGGQSTGGNPQGGLQQGSDSAPSTNGTSEQQPLFMRPRTGERPVTPGVTTTNDGLVNASAAAADAQAAMDEEEGLLPNGGASSSEYDDPSTFLKALVPVENPLVFVPPRQVFSDALAFFPDGYGADSQARVVAEPLTSDSVLVFGGQGVSAATAAVQQVIFEGLCAAGASVMEGDDFTDSPAGLQLAPSVRPMEAADAKMESEDGTVPVDGLMATATPAVRSSEIKKWVRREMRDWVTSNISAATAAAANGSNNAAKKASAATTGLRRPSVVGNAPEQQQVPRKDPFDPAEDTAAAQAALIPAPLSEGAAAVASPASAPLAALPANVIELKPLAKRILPPKPTAVPIRSAARGHGIGVRLHIGPPSRTAIGLQPTSIGSVSTRGAQSASLLPAARLQPWETDLDGMLVGKSAEEASLFGDDEASPRGADGGALGITGTLLVDGGLSANSSTIARRGDEMLLRVVRPLPGDASDLSLATRQASTLAIGVSSITFHDHPLFTAEDRAAADLRVQYAAYARHMRSDAVRRLDGRLGSLLAYSLIPASSFPQLTNGGPLGSTRPPRPGSSNNSNAAAAPTLRYEFERDSMPDLLSRLSAVLHAVSSRYDAVTTVADIMARMASRWDELQRTRREQGFVSSGVNLEIIEATAASPAASASSSGEGAAASTSTAGGAAAAAAAVPSLYPHMYGLARLLQHVRDAFHYELNPPSSTMMGMTMGMGMGMDQTMGSPQNAAPQLQLQLPSFDSPPSDPRLVGAADASAAAGQQQQQQPAPGPAANVRLSPLGEYVRLLLSAGESLLTRIREGEARHGGGYGCGGLGSGVASLAPSNSAANGGAASSTPYPAAREFLLRLHNDPSAVSDDAAVPSNERARRSAIRGCRVTVDVLVSGKFVASSGPTPLLWPDFVAPVKASIALRVYRRPGTISVRVSDVTSWFTWLLGPKVISSVFVPVPGNSSSSSASGAGEGEGEEENQDAAANIPSTAVMPVSGSFEFSSSTPLQPHPAVPPLLLPRANWMGSLGAASNNGNNSSPLAQPQSNLAPATAAAAAAPSPAPQPSPVVQGAPVASPAAAAAAAVGANGVLTPTGSSTTAGSGPLSPASSQAVIAAPPSSLSNTTTTTATISSGGFKAARLTHGTVHVRVAWTSSEVAVAALAMQSAAEAAANSIAGGAIGGKGGEAAFNAFAVTAAPAILPPPEKVNAAAGTAASGSAGGASSSGSTSAAHMRASMAAASSAGIGGSLATSSLAATAAASGGQPLENMAALMRSSLSLSPPGGSGGGSPARIVPFGATLPPGSGSSSATSSPARAVLVQPRDLSTTGISMGGSMASTVVPSLAGPGSHMLVPAAAPPPSVHRMRMSASFSLGATTRGNMGATTSLMSPAAFGGTGTLRTGPDSVTGLALTIPGEDGLDTAGDDMASAMATMQPRQVIGAPGAIYDPNDPRSLAMHRVLSATGTGADNNFGTGLGGAAAGFGGANKRARRFRVAALQDTAAFRPMPASPPRPGGASSSTALVSANNPGNAASSGLSLALASTTARFMAGNSATTSGASTGAAGAAAGLLLDLLPAASLTAGERSAYSGVTSAAGGTGLSAPGTQRLRLLRLRAERPDLFKDAKSRVPMPLRDEEIPKNAALRDLLRTVPVPAAGAADAPAGPAGGQANATAWALATLIHAALAAGIGTGTAFDATAAAGADGAITTSEGASAAAAEAAKAKLMNRIRAFQARMFASPGWRNGKGGAKKGGYVSFSSVVKELNVPALHGVDLSALFLVFAPRRKLRPLGIDAGMPMGSVSGMGPLSMLNLRTPDPGAQYRVTIQVMRARNVPVRRAGIMDARGGGKQASAVGAEEASGDVVLAMLEARFQGKVVRSAAAPGPHPQWNQVLTLPFSAPGGEITPAKLAEIQDGLTLSLFDESVAEVRVDDRDRMTTVVQRSRRFLGSVQVPFFTIYSQGGVHGELQLGSPPVLLGYRAPGLMHVPGGAIRASPSAVGTGAILAGVTAGNAGSMNNNASDATSLPMSGGAQALAALGAATSGMNAAAASVGNRPGTALVGGSSVSAPAVEIPLAAGAGVGLLQTAGLHTRLPHLFLHISVDPPLPLPADDSLGGGGDEHGGAHSVVGAGPAGPKGSIAALRRAVFSSTRGEHKRKQRAAYEHVLRWLRAYSGLKDESGRVRALKPLVQTVDGEVALVTRYLTPQLPPPEPTAAFEAAKTMLEASGKTLSHLSGNGMMRASSASATGMLGNTGGLTPLRSAGRPNTPLGSPGGPDHSNDDGAAANPLANLAGANSLAEDELPVSSLVPRISTADALARYVSLVPSLPDTQIFSRVELDADLWCTTQQTLDMGAGDEEEHAVMLHNFLLWLEGGGMSSSSAVSVPDSTSIAMPGSSALGGANQAGSIGGSSTLALPSSSGSSSIVSRPPPKSYASPAAAAADFSGQGSGWRSFLVIGRGQPEGDTVYVMRQATTTTELTVVLINASSGTCYYVEDDSCPLRSVGMVASVDNVWANIQTSTTPWRMSWDLSDARCWAPLFTPQHPFPGIDVLPLLQAPVLYRAPSTKMAWALESEVTSYLSTQLRSWRPRFITRIRGDMTLMLRGLLYELEARATGYDGPVAILGSEGRVQVGSMTGGGGGMRGSSIMPASAPPSAAGIAGALRDMSSEHQAVLEKAASRFKVVGFPLHQTFTDMSALGEAMRSTDLHRIEHEGVQYALAVVVCPYPNAVFSVWIYVVALLPQLYTIGGGAGGAAGAGGDRPLSSGGGGGGGYSGLATTGLVSSLGPTAAISAAAGGGATTANWAPPPSVISGGVGNALPAVGTGGSGLNAQGLATMRMAMNASGVGFGVAGR